MKLEFPIQKFKPIVECNAFYFRHNWVTGEMFYEGAMSILVFMHLCFHEYYQEIRYYRIFKKYILI